MYVSNVAPLFCLFVLMCVAMRVRLSAYLSYYYRLFCVGLSMCMRVVAQLKNSENFIYLGSNLSFSGDLTNEIQRRINLASSAFGRLSNQNTKIHIKIAVYNAVVVSTILYGCETWIPYRRHIRPLESFHIRRLQLILRLRKWRKVTHSEIGSRTGIPSI